MSVLNDIDDYRETVTFYRENIYSQNGRAWFIKYMDGKNVLVSKTTGEIYYKFQKKYSSDLQTRKDALVELDNLVKKYNEKLQEIKEELPVLEKQVRVLERKR